VDKRMFGLDSEYGITCEFRGDRRLLPDEVARDVFRRVASGAGALLSNEARLNLMAPSHPEYATPTCGSLPDLIAHDKAGERILEELGAAAQGRLREAGIDGDVRVFKTSSDPAGNSPGCRENFLVSRYGDFGRLAGMLIPFLVTRQVICGAGQVTPTPQGAVYCLSQGPKGVSSPARFRSRPLINTRDEPHVAARGFRRLQVAVSEPNMSETTVLLKVGATGLVLDMIEAGTVLPDLILDNPIGALRAVSLDLTGRTPVRLADGRELSALEIQREYLAKTKDLTERDGSDATSERLLGLWERVLDSVEAGNLDAIAREIDWVTKYQLIEGRGLPLSSPQVAQLDLAYHDVNRGKGGYYLLQRNGEVDRVVRDIDIFEAKTIPPAPGRYRQAG